MTAITILLGAALTLATCLTAGRLLLRLLGADFHRGEEDVIAFGIGAAALSTLTFLLCATQLAYQAVFLAVALTAIQGAAYAGLMRRSPRLLPDEPRWAKWVFRGILAAFGVVYFLHAMAPEVSPDGVSYHLSLAARYLREHGFVRIPDMYAFLPGGMEMLFLFAFAFGEHSAAAMVHFGFLLGLALAMRCYARRFGLGHQGVFAAAAVFVTPVIGIDGTSAYNDVAIAFTGFLVFYLLEIWDSDRRPLFLLLAGMLAGFAFAIKYTAVFVVGYAVLRAAWGSRGMRAPLVVAGCASVMIAPWLVKNWLYAANPLAPFANAWFPNPNLHIASEEFYMGYMRDLANWDLKSAWEIPRALTIDGKLSGILGPLYLLSPLALVGLRNAAGRRLLTALAVYAAAYPLNIGCRFLIPSLPLVAFAAGGALANQRVLAMTLLAAHSLLCWPSVVPRYALPHGWFFKAISIRDAFRPQAREAFRSRWAEGYAEARLIEDSTPEGARVLAFSNVAQSYTSREILVPYRSAQGEYLRDMLYAVTDPGLVPTRRIRFRVAETNVKALRVEVTPARVTRHHWTVSEFRIYLRERELARDPGWWIRARPNPWDVPLAFDSSPATRWQTWETVRPGMYVEVEFPTPQAADAVVLECAGDYWADGLRLQARTSTGAWVTLSDRPEIMQNQASGGLRRAAAAEFIAHGVRYLLMDRLEDLTGDLRARAPEWGLTLAGETNRAQLFRIP